MIYNSKGAVNSLFVCQQNILAKIHSTSSTLIGFETYKSEFQTLKKYKKNKSDTHVGESP